MPKLNKGLPSYLYLGRQGRDNKGSLVEGSEIKQKYRQVAVEWVLIICRKQASKASYIGKRHVIGEGQCG